MAERHEQKATNWDSVFEGMKQHLAMIPMPAEFYRQGVLEMQERLLLNYPDELRATCESQKKLWVGEGYTGSDNKVAIEAFILVACKHNIPFEFDPKFVMARVK